MLKIIACRSHYSVQRTKGFHLFAGPNANECFISVASVKVRCMKRTAELLFQMRSLLDQVLATKIGTSSEHTTTHNPFEEQVLK